MELFAVGLAVIGLFIILDTLTKPPYDGDK